MCEKNAASEGVATRCRFQHGDAHQLDFPDDTFDAVVSNYVYHNITGADKQALLRETLRVLKSGGVFALNDDMKPRMYGDMEAFAQDLREAGFQEVRLVDTATEVDDGTFGVKVTVEPLDVFDRVAEALWGDTPDARAEALYSQDVDSMTDEEYAAYDAEWCRLAST